MRAAETRIMILLLTAVCVAVGASYALVLEQGPHTSWTLSRGGLLVGGAAACAILSLVALHGDSRRHRRRIMESACDWVLAGRAGGAGGQVLKDPDVQPFIAPLRQRLEELSNRAESLALQKKNLEIQLRLADAQRRQSQIMIHGIYDAVIISDAFDELIQANPAAADLFKFDAGKPPSASRSANCWPVRASAGRRYLRPASELQPHQPPHAPSTSSTSTAVRGPSA